LTIGELGIRTGLPPSAIRYYEQEKLIPAAPRSGGKRVFDESMVERLTMISVAKEAGFSIAEIRQLVGSFGGERWRKLAERKRAEIRATADRLRLMDRLLQSLLDCGCFDVEECGRILRRYKTTS
jgi:MerR family redox-sensitive transcriptional activator SoxR